MLSIFGCWLSCTSHSKVLNRNPIKIKRVKNWWKWKFDLLLLLLWMRSSRHQAHTVCNIASMTLCPIPAFSYRPMYHLLATSEWHQNWTLLSCRQDWRRNYPFSICHFIRPTIFPLLGIWPFCLILRILARRPSFCRHLSKRWELRGRSCGSQPRCIHQISAPPCQHLHYFRSFWARRLVATISIVSLFVRGRKDPAAPHTDYWSQAWKTRHHCIGCSNCPDF